MAAGGRKPQLVAVDTNVLLDRAADDETVLLSSDAHASDVDYPRLEILLEASDVAAPLIASPYQIVHQFFH